MKSSVLGICLVIISLVFADLSAADPSNFEISGSARVRAESKSNGGFNDSVPNYTNFIASRFRVDMKFKPNEKVNVFFQPQFSKSWGEPEMVPTSTTANTSTSSSGATNDTGFDVHQAYMSYLASESLSVTLGRKELNHGDQLLVGGVGWNNVGRSFDLGLAEFKYNVGTAEVFSAKIKDSNTTAPGVGDKDFSGVYSSNHFGDKLQNVDVYAYLSEDHSSATPVTTPTETSAYGLRLKSPVANFDYRVESTWENVKTSTDSSGEKQVDAEIGYTIVPSHKTRVSARYFRASENFDQLYPTGHKWLGYADLFSRRNITGFRVGASSQIVERLSVSLDYYDYSRVATSAPAYTFGGASYGTAGSSAAVATEMDLVLTYKLQGDVGLEAGASRAIPAAYLKDNGRSDVASFYYFAVNTNF